MYPDQDNNQTLSSDQFSNTVNTEPSQQPETIPTPQPSQDPTQPSSQPQSPSQPSNINISGPSVQTSSPKMPSVNFGRPDANQSSSTIQQSPGLPPKKSKKGLIIALVIIMLIALGGAAYYFLVMSKDSTNTNQSNSNASGSQQDSEEAGELVKTVYQVSTNGLTDPIKVAVEHPGSWEVIQEEPKNENGFVINGDMKIISPKGNMLLLSDVSQGGVGGDCYGDIRPTLG